MAMFSKKDGRHTLIYAYVWLASLQMFADIGKNFAVHMSNTQSYPSSLNFVRTAMQKQRIFSGLIVCCHGPNIFDSSRLDVETLHF